MNPYPTKHLCILVPAPLWYLICINFLHWCKKNILLVLFGKKIYYILCQFSIITKNNDARTELLDYLAIWTN